MARWVLHFSAGVLVLMLIAEVALRLLPVSTATLTGYHHDPMIVTYPSDHEWRVATGWDLRNAQPLKANNWGFVAGLDFEWNSTAIALIGDSYVEASMLAADERPAAQLQRIVPGGRAVYAMGGPGSALLDYAERIRLAATQFGIRDFVLLLEASDARQSICGSGNVHAPCLDASSLQPRVERLADASLAKRLLRHSALAQYLVGQIRFKPSVLWTAMWTRTVPEAAGVARAGASAEPSNLDVRSMQRRVDAVVDEFWKRAAPHISGRLVVVVDGRRSGPPQTVGIGDLERAYLIGKLTALGVEVRDMEPVFARHVRSSPWSLVVGPHDQHLNSRGVALVVSVVAEALKQ
jgi:hypothetical protein